MGNRPSRTELDVESVPQQVACSAAVRSASTWLRSCVHAHNPRNCAQLPTYYPLPPPASQLRVLRVPGQGVCRGRHQHTQHAGAAGAPGAKGACMRAPICLTLFWGVGVHRDAEGELAGPTCPTCPHPCPTSASVHALVPACRSQVAVVRSEVKNKLFVGNLPRDMGRETLLVLLEKEVKVGGSQLVVGPGPVCWLPGWSPGAREGRVGCLQADVRGASNMSPGPTHVTPSSVPAGRGGPGADAGPRDRRLTRLWLPGTLQPRGGRGGPAGAGTARLPAWRPRGGGAKVVGAGMGG